MNHLLNSTSTYLRQSTHQPVDWWPWCNEAFELARQEKKPILVDVGASWCHWCHVMDQENYEDQKTATLINKHFVAIKVDRDERPDVDRRLQESAAALCGQGGWPLTVFLLPTGKPFFGGTYFPPQPRHGMPSFVQILEHILEQLKNHHDELTSLSDAIANHVQQLAQEELAQEESASPCNTAYQPPSELIPLHVSAVLASRDAIHGGFGFAPKFPNPETILFLLQYYERTKEPETLSTAEHALAGMACGGIHDHVGGGFHRYSTDAKWRVPHFEKMIAENAMLLRCYLQAYRITHKHLYKEVSLGILRWMLDEMHDPQGGFYASQDADFEGEEGRYFTWTDEEILCALGPEDAKPFLEAFELEPIEGDIKKVLLKKNNKNTSQENSAFTSACLEALYEQRKQRGKAPTDTTIYTHWSCLAAIACLEASMILDNLPAKKAALNTLSYLSTTTILNGLPTHRKGQTTPLFSDDAVAMCHAFISGYEATLEWKYITDAEVLADTILSTFGTSSRLGICDTTGEPEEFLLGIRNVSIWDFAQPGTNPLFATCLQKLALYCERSDLAAQAEGILSLGEDKTAGMALHASTMNSSRALMLYGLKTAVIVGGIEGSGGLQPLLQAFHHSYSLGCAILTTKNPHTLLEGKTCIQGKPTAYVCRGMVCGPPVTSPKEIEKS